MIRTVDDLLRSRSAQNPDKTFLRFTDRELSYAEVNDAAQAVATRLDRIGLGAAEPIAVLLPNCAEFVVLWFAANKLGAVAAPVNVAMRGPALSHMLNLTQAKILVIDARYLDAIDAISTDLNHVQYLIVRGDVALAEAILPNSTVLSLASLFGETIAPTATATATLRPGAPVKAVPVAAADPSIMLCTSGTTGRSKACVLSHHYVIRQAELLIENYELRPDDVLYCPFPLFHLDAAVLTVMPALVLGATAAIGERFSVSGFWAEVHAFEATIFDFMGATLTLLHQADPRPDDADNQVRLAWGVPVPAFAAEFESRFGLRLVELYGSTDAGVPVYQPLSQPRRPGSCGRPISAYDVRLFDRFDLEVPTGSVGEIVIRPREPDLLASGYYGQPAETNEARRNLWFHTGDLARFDEDGYLYFVGRGTDSIRRRGENISAFEVEEVINSHPDVLETAAFGVPSDLTEEEVMVAVVPRQGRIVRPADLVEFCADRMARYMVPRYIDIVTQLPRTPTEKIEKYLLGRRGITPTTWDRAEIRPLPVDRPGWTRA